MRGGTGPAGPGLTPRSRAGSVTLHDEPGQLVLSSGSGEVTKVPVCGFLQTATTSWNSMWERWPPDFQLRGGLCGNEELKSTRDGTEPFRASSDLTQSAVADPSKSTVDLPSSRLVHRAPLDFGRPVRNAKKNVPTCSMP